MPDEEQPEWLETLNSDPSKYRY